MTSPNRYLLRMVLFLIGVLGVVATLAPRLIDIFLHNIALNGLIVAVLVFGLVLLFLHVWRLGPAVRWIENFRPGDPGIAVDAAPDILASMAAMLAGRHGRLTLSPTSMRTLLDGIASRIEESRDTARYFIGLLVFLGLLGTFWGLLQTVNAVGGTIQNLQMSSEDTNALFAQLQRGLEAPLGGMGLAFSASLLGLAGSLILGFMELQASQAQGRFYNDLEEWLSGYTKLSTGGGFGAGTEDQSVPAYVQALLEQTAESLDKLQRSISHIESSRTGNDSAMLQLVERLATLNDQMRTEQDLMVHVAKTQSDLKPVLQKLAEAGPTMGGGFSKTAEAHLRNLDVCVTQLLQENARAREDLKESLRSEIKLLARTIAAGMNNNANRQS